MQITRGILLLACVFGLGSLGCNAEAQQCSPVAGLYEPLYTYVSGNCGPSVQTTSQVNFDSGRHGVLRSQQSLPNMTVTTEVILKGCSVHLNQQISGPQGGPLQTQIDGESIAISNQEQLTGMVEVTQYSPTGEVMCSGMYNGMFSKGSKPGGDTVPGFAGSGS